MRTGLPRKGDRERRRSSCSEEGKERNKMHELMRLRNPGCGLGQLQTEGWN